MTVQVNPAVAVEPEAGPQITVLRAADVRPGMDYPYLPTEWDWEIRSIPLALFTGQEPEPTLRLVKDNKVLDIYVPGMETATFLNHWGLGVSMHKGGYVLSKRLGRLFHPYRYWRFLPPDAVGIAHVPEWDAQLWDGCGRVSRLFLLEQLLPTLADLPAELRTRYETELCETERWEVTLVHAGGEEKGDVLVVDQSQLPAGADFAFPAGSAKTEIWQTGSVFVGLAQARHHKDGMLLDLQSLINLYPFFQPEQLLQWLKLESGLFLEALDAGRVGRIYSRLAHDEARLAKLANWHVGEYLASGGDPRWFAGILRDLGRQHLRRLVDQVEGKVRFPVPGGRYYIFPGIVGGRAVPRGQVELDPRGATAWVNDQDWCEFIVEILGGCDGDDAVRVFPFTDEDGTQKILVWRNPNQLGEYVLLTPTDGCHTIRWAIPDGESIRWPPLNSADLPSRVDTVPYTYAELEELDTGEAQGYSVAAMATTIQLARTNQGTLGAVCNLQMLTTALYKRLPLEMPAKLETIIDGSVKKFLDLTPVKAWVERGALAIVNQGKPVPACLRDRLEPLLPRRERRRIRTSTDHWLDTLITGVQLHQAQYEADLEQIARRCMPPLTLFRAVLPQWKTEGRALRQCYADVLRRGGTPREALGACERFLQTVSPMAHGQVLLVAAAHCYTLGQQDADAALTDNVVWQLGRKRAGGGREPGLAQAFLEVLRGVGLLGEPLWTSEGAVLYWRAAVPRPRTAIAVTLKGCWFNWLRATQDDIPDQMSLVAVEERERAKAAVVHLADRLVALPLTRGEVAERVVLHGPRGHLLGYVQRGQEVPLGMAERWQLVWATATDGNLHTVLAPLG